MTRELPSAYQPKRGFMSDNNIGSIITTEQTKDAIHVAICPVVADEELFPGEHIGLVEGSFTRACTKSKEHIGIVDPYLKAPVYKEQEFWMFLYPNTVTSLKHQWEHPAFKGDNSRDMESERRARFSEGWLRSFAENEADLSYQELMDAAADYLENGEYFSDGGKFEGFDFPDSLFWQHYENVTGLLIEEEDKHSFFTCSC